MTKPNINILKEKGVEALNLDNLKNKSIEELENSNPDFLFEKSYDEDGTEFGFYIAYRYYTTDEGSWRHLCQLGSPIGFSIDFTGETFDTLYNYLDYLDTLD